MPTNIKIQPEEYQEDSDSADDKAPLLPKLEKDPISVEKTVIFFIKIKLQNKK